MITTKKELLSILDKENIDYNLFEHSAVFTATEGKELCEQIPGVHVKNLFLRDEKKRVYILVTVNHEKRVDLKALGNLFKLGRLSFVNQTDLYNILGVTAGSVTPIAIINDSEKKIKLILDSELSKEEIINIHPMINTATISLKLNDLVQFIQRFWQSDIEFIEVPS